MKKLPRVTKKWITICISIVAIAVVATVLWNVYDSNKQAPVSTTGWKEFSDTTTNLSFKYPQNTKPFSDPSAAEAIKTGYIQYILNSPSYSLDQNYKNAEAEIPGKTLTLEILASTTKPEDYITSTNGNFGTLDSSDKTTNLWKSGAFNYVLLLHGKRWGNRMHVLQCVDGRKCRSTIERDDQQFKYLQIDVYANENWRHGGSNIDTKSPDYPVFTEVVRTIKF